MDHTLEFFSSLADLSQTVLMASVVELARRRDFTALGVFMDFATSRSPALGVFEKNEGIGFQIKGERASNDPDLNASVTCRLQRYSDALMIPVMIPIRDAKTVQINALKALDATELAHACRVFDLFKDRQNTEAWRDALLCAICRGVNDPQLVPILVNKGFSLDRLTTSGLKDIHLHPNVKKDSVPPAVEAVIFGNLELATALYRQTPAMVLENFMSPANRSRSSSGEITVLATCLQNDASAVVAVLNAVEEKIGAQTALDFRFKVAKEYLNQVNRMEMPACTQTVEAVFGSTPQSRQALTQAIESARPEAVDLCNSFVAQHCAELLPLFEKMINPTTTSLSQKDRPDLKKCIGLNSIKLNDLAADQRFRETVKFFLDHGHPLDSPNAKEPTGALLLLAQSGHKIDRERKLHVLLSLGADPMVKDDRKWTARSYVPADERDRWDTVVNSFRARTKAMALLDEMDAPDIDKPAKRTRKTQ